MYHRWVSENKKNYFTFDAEYLNMMFPHCVKPNLNGFVYLFIYLYLKTETSGRAHVYFNYRKENIEGGVGVL